MSLPIDRTTKSALDTNLVNGNTSDAPVIKNSNDVVYNTIDELYNYTSGLVAGGVLQPYPAFLSRQALINGNFDLWQRGTSFSANAYGPDRWFSFRDGSAEVSTLSQQAFTLGQGIVPYEPKYFSRKQATTPGTGQTVNYLTQRIESVRSLAGSKVTVSFWAKADVARTIQTNFNQFFGTGGTPSAPVNIVAQSHNLTTSWQKFIAKFDIPSISGKIIGTNGDDYLSLFLSYPLNSLFTIDIAQVQINAGDQALPFQPKSFADELALCQRYYEKSYNYSDALGTVTTAGYFSYKTRNAVGASVTGGLNIGMIPFKVKKRTIPTVTLYGTNATTGAVRVGTVTARTGCTATAIGESGFAQINIDASSPTVINLDDIIDFHWTVDAEL